MFHKAIRSHVEGKVKSLTGESFVNHLLRLGVKHYFVVSPEIGEGTVVRIRQGESAPDFTPFQDFARFVHWHADCELFVCRALRKERVNVGSKEHQVCKNAEGQAGNQNADKTANIVSTHMLTGGLPNSVEATLSVWGSKRMMHVASLPPTDNVAGLASIQLGVPLPDIASLTCFVS